jgi:ElaB/YqjD/DUF883 family membrane-anchored ribosome-binding protein
MRHKYNPESAASVISNLKDHACNMGGQVRESTNRMYHSAEDGIAHRPITSVGIAFAAGAALAVLLTLASTPSRHKKS